MTTDELSAAAHPAGTRPGARPTLRRMIENRSGRVVAVGRATLAAYFIFVLWADPKQPEVHPAFAQLFLWSYVVLAAAYVAGTWNRWWLEARLPLPFHALDLIV